MPEAQSGPTCGSGPSSLYGRRRDGARAPQHRLRKPVWTTHMDCRYDLPHRDSVTPRPRYLTGPHPRKEHTRLVPKPRPCMTAPTDLRIQADPIWETKRFASSWAMHTLHNRLPVHINHMTGLYAAQVRDYHTYCKSRGSTATTSRHRRLSPAQLAGLKAHATATVPKHHQCPDSSVTGPRTQDT